MLSIGPTIDTYFGKILEELVRKGAKVDGQKPSIQARLNGSILKQFHLPTIPIDIIL